jgi:hypothetical protein
MNRSAKYKALVTVACVLVVFVLSGPAGVAYAGGNGFSVNLASSTSSVWIGQDATLTATTNADVGPTPYYVSIYDTTAHTEVAICGTGTMCIATVAQRSIGTHSYQAYVGDYPAPTSAPGFILTSSATVSVTWWFIFLVR